MKKKEAQEDTESTGSIRRQRKHRKTQEDKGKHKKTQET